MTDKCLSVGRELETKAPTVEGYAVISAETKLHATVFAVSVALVVGFSGQLLPLLAILSPAMQAVAILLAVLLSFFGYSLLSTYLLEVFRSNPATARFLLGNEYIGGTYLGWIRSTNGYYALGIEQVHQGVSSLHTKGESYKPDLMPGAEWYSTCACVETGHRLHIAYRTKMLGGLPGQSRITEGFGVLTVDAPYLTGEIIDRPEEVDPQSDMYRRRSVYYRLKRISPAIIPFEDVRKTRGMEWDEAVDQLRTLGPEWSAPAQHTL